MIRRNPFNVLGLLAGVPEKEVAKRKAQINAYLNVGKEITFPEDIPMAVEGLVRTQESVAKALSEIDQYSKRAVHALYWFTEGGRADGPALAHLRDGDVEKARDIWYRVASAGDLTSQSISSCSNLGTLALLNGAADSDEILVGVRWKAKLFGSEHLPELLTRMSDASVAKDVNGVAAKWAEHLAIWLIPTYALDKDFMEKLGGAFAMLTEPIRTSIRKPFEQHYEKEVERMVTNCQVQRKKVPGDADKAGALLLKSGKALLPAYAGFAGSDAIGFHHAADQFAEELLECAITHYNDHVDHDTVHTGPVRNLVKAAESFAHGRMLKARIADNAKGMEDYFADEGERIKFRQVKPSLDKIEYQVLLLERNATGMEPVAAFVSNCTPLLDTLGTALGRTEVLYVNISSTVVNKALQRMVNVVNAAQNGATPSSAQFKYLLTTLDQAKDLTERMARMVMHPDLRTRFEANQKTLQGLVFQVRMVAAQTPRSTSGCLGQVAAIALFLFLGWMLT